MKFIIFKCVLIATICKLSFAVNCTTDEDRSALFGNMDVANGADIPYEICTPSQLDNVIFYPSSNFILGDDLDFDYSNHKPITQIFSGSIDGNGKIIRNLVMKSLYGQPVGLFETASNATFLNLTMDNIYVEGIERVGLLAGQWREGGLISNVSINSLRVKGQSFTGGLIGLVNGGSSAVLDINQVSIAGLTINANSNVGGIIGLNNAETNDLNISDVTIDANISANSLVGGIVGQSTNTNFGLTNIQASGLVTCYLDYCGGLIGRTQNLAGLNNHVTSQIISNIHSVDSYTGGLIGHCVLNLSLQNSSYNGSITAEGNYVGGIAGAMYNANITQVTSSGTITVQDNTYGANTAFVGGLVGFGAGVSTIDQSNSSMAVVAHGQYVGGLAGSIREDASQVLNSYSSGSVYGRTSFVGGLIGFFNGVTLQDSYATGNVTVEFPTPKAYIGGLLGYANSWNSAFTRIHALGNVDILNGTADYTGGLIGFFRGGNLSNCYANGSVTGGRNSSGGLVGIHRGFIDQCYAIGNVSATGAGIGGLVGHFNAGGITNTFSAGNVSGKINVGGLIGNVYSQTSDLVLQTSHAIGNVERIDSTVMAPASFGKLVGTSSFDQNISASLVCSLESTVIDLATGQALAGYNTRCIEENKNTLKNSSAYIGYDFTNVWDFPSGKWTFPNSSIGYTAAKFIITP